MITPTLTGLGQRSHLCGSEINLSNHVDDILKCVEAEELENFILVGHSYAGMVITGVADRIPDRISALVYLDALVPEDGECAADLVSRGVDYSIFADGMLPVIEDYDFGLTDPEDIAWVRRRITQQSVATVTEALRFKTNLSRTRRVFVECTEERAGQPQMHAIASIAERLSTDPSWRLHKLTAGHDCMISNAEETARLLLAIACDEA